MPAAARMPKPPSIGTPGGGGGGACATATRTNPIRKKADVDIFISNDFILILFNDDLLSVESVNGLNPH
jgi:hypothetical protein